VKLFLKKSLLRTISFYRSVTITIWEGITRALHKLTIQDSVTLVATRCQGGIFKFFE